MAAVLCKGCTTACDGCCKLLSVPCKLFGECCNVVTEGISQLCTNPFCFFVVVALAINIPSIASSLPPLVTNGIFGCLGLIWLAGNVIFCTINIIAALYIALRYNQLMKERNTHTTNTGTSSSAANNHNRRSPWQQQRQQQQLHQQHGRPSGFQHASNILCHDPFVAIYILILIGFFIWLCLGVNWRASGQMYCINDENSYNFISTALGCGFSYFGSGFMALCLSICCSCCCCCGWNDERRGDSSSGNNPYYNQNQYGTAGGGSRPSTARATARTTTSAPNQNQNYPPFRPYNNVQYPAATATATPVTAVPVPVDSSTTHKPIYASVVQNDEETPPPPVTPTAPAAPPFYNDENDSLDDETSAVAKGSAFGAKIAKLFNANQSTQSKMETAGVKASVAINQGMKKAQEKVGFKKK